MNFNASQTFNSVMQSGSLNDDPSEIDENLPEHWQQQLHVLAEYRQLGLQSHKHSRKGAATLAIRPSTHNQTDDSAAEPVERNRAAAIQEEPRQDWDGMDMSGQGLRSLSVRLFRDYSFLTRLYIDGNRLTVLPFEISSLQHLILLQASNNQIRELPESIGMLSNLEQLLVFDNQIRVLPSEIGYLFRLEMLGVEGNPLDEETKEFLIHHGTAALVAHMRDSTEGKELNVIFFGTELFANSVAAGTPPRSRPMHVLDDSDAVETVTILSHNILCDRYATRTQYKHTPARALQWEYRRDLVFEEIKELNADIVCLQEIDQENFNEFFRKELAILGFKGFIWQKSRARTMIEREAKLVDGCAIFYRASKYILLDKQLIGFANTAINRPDMKGEHDIFNRVMPRDNIAVVGFFENRMTGSRMIVANAHLHWDVKEEDVKIVQAAILMEQVAEYADKWADFPPCLDKSPSRFADMELDIDTESPEFNVEPAPSQKYANGTQLPLIVAGDFNSLKSSAIYELLSKGFIKKDTAEFTGRSYGKYTRDGISHPFNLRNAYAGEPEDYIAITNYTPDFQGCIEYIFHSPSLRRRKLLGNVDFEHLRKIPGFPSYHFPSDHLTLFAEFSVEHRKERSKVEAEFGPQERKS